MIVGIRGNPRRILHLIWSLISWIKIKFIKYAKIIPKPIITWLIVPIFPLIWIGDIEFKYTGKTLEDRPLAIPNKNLATPILTGSREYSIIMTDTIEITSVNNRTECVLKCLLTLLYRRIPKIAPKLRPLVAKEM